MTDLLGKKKHITEITNEFKVYWLDMFTHMGIEKPLFLSKLGYLGNEFESIDGSRSLCVRFFGNELSNGQDIYIELFDWDQNYYHANERVLYKLKYNPNWKTDTKNYYEITKKNDGSPMTTPSYAVRVSDMEIVSKNNIKELGPQLHLFREVDSRLLEESKKTDLAPDAEESFSKEKEDAHYAQMTIRDIYCIIHNKPLSNKKWLNNLIQYNK